MHHGHQVYGSENEPNPARANESMASGTEPAIGLEPSESPTSLSQYSSNAMMNVSTTGHTLCVGCHPLCDDVLAGTSDNMISYLCKP